MRIAALADVLKILLYVIASFLLAALISPTLFDLGKGFANLTSGKTTADQMAWLASKAEGASFTAYFKKALFISALICLIPLFCSLDLRRHARPRKGNPWTIGLPPQSTPPRMGQALRNSQWGIFQSLTGFCLSAGCSLALAWLVFALDWFQWQAPPSANTLWATTWSALKSALLLAIIIETIFRGALLGIFLRAFRPSIAIPLLSLTFASAYFLIPSHIVPINDPQAARAGFEILGQLYQKFLNREILIQSFIPLFIVGLILGMTRYRTSALWLPIGLHTGWIFSHQLFTRLTERRSDLPEHFRLYIGPELKDGLLSISLLLLIGLIVILYLQFLQFSKKPPAPEREE